MTIYSGKTIQDAVEQGLTALSLTQDQVEVTVIQQPKNGFLGFGRKLAQVELAKKNQILKLKQLLINQAKSQFMMPILIVKKLKTPLMSKKFLKN